MRQLLVLRPEPGASATVERARERGLSALAIPLFQVEPVDWKVPDVGGFDGLLLTSANAVHCARAQLTSLRGLKIFAVGEATGEAARNEGFDIAAIGDAGVDRLLESIDPDLHLLHLCGEDRRIPKQPRQAITPIVVYKSTPIEAPDLSIVRGSVALVHSCRAAARFAQLVCDRRSLAIAAISVSAGESAGNGWERVEVADRPADDALLALAARLCNNSPPE